MHKKAAGSLGQNATDFRAGESDCLEVGGCRWRVRAAGGRDGLWEGSAELAGEDRKAESPRGKMLHCWQAGIGVPAGLFLVQIWMHKKAAGSLGQNATDFRDGASACLAAGGTGQFRAAIFLIQD